MSKVKVSMMSLKTVLNYSVGSTSVLVATGVGVFLRTAEGRSIMFVGSVSEGSNTVELMSEGVECLVRAAQ